MSYYAAAAASMLIAAAGYADAIDFHAARIAMPLRR